MAKKPLMFGGKESAREERAEKRVGPKAYAAGEKREGEKPPFGAKKAAPFGAKKAPPFGGKAKPFAEGGEVAPAASVREGANSNIDDDVRARAMRFVNGGGDKPVAKPKPKAYPEAGPIREAAKPRLSDKYPEPQQVRAARKPGIVERMLARKPIKPREPAYPEAGPIRKAAKKPTYEAGSEADMPVTFAKGGTVRGAGAATKGKKFSSC